uniref:Ribosomal protein L34 n=1 Tax=Renouxia sp. TaxID=2485823 RepID=A0A3G3MHR7_9FLOR|nr:ribosomal protein L34 [Renouxia sp.]
MSKRILRGTRRKKAKKSGFRIRMKTNSGCKIIRARRRKSRKVISI